MDQQEYARTSAAYLRFADEEARDRSALYDELARGVASDPLVIAFLLTLPKEKRQPNLLFAATRLLFGTPSGWCQFRHVLRENEDAIRAIMLKRSTQTNEPARCATLLPVLARLPQPLGFGLHPLATGARGICTICKDPLRFLDLERVTTYLPEDSCSCRHGGAERLLPDGREWGSGGLDRPTRRIPRLDL